MKRARVGFAVLATLCGSCGGAPPPAAPVLAGPGVAPPPPTASAAPSPPPEPAPLGQLPRDVRPLRERLDLAIDPEAERFGGTASIDLAIDSPHASIWMHGRGLAVTSCDVALAGGDHVACTWSEVDPSGVAHVVFARPVAGAATIAIRYDAPYDSSLVGVYRTSVAGGGHAVFSKFEATYARRAFPCFDEPSFKIPFDVALTVPKGAVALGNMPIAKTGEGTSGAQSVTFATTPPLPTYLVAFAVGPFEARATIVPPSALRAMALPMAVDALRGRSELTKFAAAEVPAFVTEEERYYGVAFPFPKLDLLAIPDFQSGAMENAGLITYRDAALLVDPASATLSQRISVLEASSHELAHQWFGDLVTMGWWDDLWLNESFASFLSTRTLVAVKPELEAELFEVGSTDRVMGLDGLASARRIRQPIKNTDDITNAFDGITYDKGEAVLAMVERFVGDDAFRRGLHEYLTSHAGGNATTSDLVSALSKAAGRDLAPLFASFLDQPGVPLVTARPVCDGGKGSIALSQKRWIPVGSDAQSDLAWNVPVCVRAGVAGKAQTACTLLGPEGGSVELAGGCADWVMPNADARGYYRFVLEGDGFARLRDHGVKLLATTERLALASDLDAVFRSATLASDVALHAVEPLARDAHGAVATAPLGLYRFVGENVLSGAASTKFRAYVRALYAPAARSLGWRASPKESTWRALERTSLLAFLARTMDDPAVLAEGARLGRAYLGIGKDGALHPEVVDPDLVGLALSAAMRKGDARVFDALLDALAKSEDGPKRRAFLVALGSTTDVALASRALDLALDARLRKTERLAPVLALLDSAATRDLAWRWLVAHFDALAPVLPDRYAGRIPAYLRFCDAKRAEDVETFFAPRMLKQTGGPRNLAQAVEAIKSCAALADKQRPSAEAFLK